MNIGASYIPPHQPVHIKSDIQYMKEIGCNQVMFALQENHFQWLDGSLRFGADIAKDNGLLPRALVWGYANTSGGGKNSKVMLENPDIWRCDPSGKPYGGGYPNPKACYNNPKTLELYKTYAEEIKEHGYEGVMIDEPTSQTCFCEFCRKKYRSIFNSDLKNEEGSKEYKMFQHSTVVDFAVNSFKVIKNVDNGLQTSICLMPSDIDKFEGIVISEHLDVFGTDPYWLRPVNELSFERAVEVVRFARKIASDNKKQLEIYLGCFGIASGLEEQIYSGSKVLIEESCPDYVTAWSFRGGLGLTTRYLEW